MAGNRAAARRTPTSGFEPSREQIVVLIAIVVVAVAAVIVLVGMYLTVYRPPRAHVLTADSKTYTVDDVKRRAIYILLYQQAIAGTSPSQITTTTLDTLEREAILRARAGALVPAVTPDDINTELEKLLAPPLPPAAPTVQVQVPGQATSTPTPTPTPTATPTVDRAAYTRALQQRLAATKLTKAELDNLVAAGLYEDRLRGKMKAELPKTLPQVRIVTARVASQQMADQIRSIGLRPGVDFGPVASQNSVSDPKGARAGVATWVIVDQLDAPSRDAVKDLKTGEMSAVTKNGSFFEVYKVVEVSAARELEEAQQEDLVTAQEMKWFEAERQNIKIERDLTPEKEEWITTRALAGYQKAAGTPRAR